MAEEFLKNEVDAGPGGPLLVGFDLGTSWTEVMTNRGHSERIRSVVGYPKDMIGIKLLGEPFVVGENAFEMRSYVELRSPLKDGVLREFIERDIEVARNFVGHVIGNLDRDGDAEICVIVGVPARASNNNKDLMLKIFQEFADEVQVISEPFLVAYSQGTLVNCLVIDIGAGTVDICALKGAMPGEKSQVTVNRAGNFVDQKLEALIVETYPGVQTNPYIVSKLKEEHSYVGQPNGQIIADFRADGKPVSYDITEAVGAACEMLLPGITEGVERLIQTVSPEDQETVRAEIGVHKPSDAPCCTEEMHEHMIGMMKMMHTSKDPMAMYQQMMGMCQQMAETLGKGPPCEAVDAPCCEASEEAAAT